MRMGRGGTRELGISESEVLATPEVDPFSAVWVPSLKPPAAAGLFTSGDVVAEMVVESQCDGGYRSKTCYVPRPQGS